MENKNIAIFCGSAFGKDPIYKEKSIKAAKALAQHGYNLVYGGGYLGLMGQIGETFFDEGREVFAIMPEMFNKPTVHVKNVYTSLTVTKDMHERKAAMYEKADAFLIFPGGIGTFDEFFEIYTWKQLRLHNKNVIIYNINGFYDSLLRFLDEVHEEGFTGDAIYHALQVANTEEELLDLIEAEPVALPNKVG